MQHIFSKKNLLLDKNTYILHVRFKYFGYYWKFSGLLRRLFL